MRNALAFCHLAEIIMNKVKMFRSEILEEYTPIAIDNLTPMPSKPKFSILNFMLIPLITIGVYVFLFTYVLKSTGNFYLFFVISAIIGIVTSIIRFSTERVIWNKACKRITKDNLSYITDLADKSKKSGSKYKEGLNQCFPILTGGIDYDWIRTPNQKSFLMIRVGLYTAKNPAALYYSDSNLAEEFDSKYKSIVEKTLLIDSVPYVLDLRKNKIIGVFGINKEYIFNSLLMNTIIFHSEDDLRVCTLNTRSDFSWCKKIPHSNNDFGINLYAEKTKDIPEIVKKFSGLIDLKDNRWNILILTSDTLLQIRQIRDIVKADNTQIIVLCDGNPTSYCDVVIGDNTVSYSKKIAKDIVYLDQLPLVVSEKYMYNFTVSKRNSESFKEEENKLPSYIDAFAFFGEPKNE